MQLHPALVLLGGLVIIGFGAELLLRGASRLAMLLGVRPVIIGLTVVALGTSMPELAVGVTAALEGHAGLAVGNIAGSNIFNILVILGLSALWRPLPLHLLSLKLDVPVMIGASLALVVMAWDGVLSRVDGLLLLSFGLSYTLALILLSRHESPAMRREFAEEFGPAQAAPLSSVAALLHSRWARGVWHAVKLLAGIALTLLGAELMVSGAEGLARSFGVSDTFIGLTIVAIGTSAPELATTLVATRKDDRDVAIGNLVGSCIYNILLILGLSTVLVPDGLPVGRHSVWIDLPLTALVAIVLLPVFRTGDSVSRREAMLFLLAYVAYFSSLLVWQR